MSGQTPEQQTQMQVMKLLTMLKDYFASLFMKDKGNGIMKLDEAGLKKFNNDLGSVVDQQREKAQGFVEDGDYLKAAYLNTRADILDDMNKSLSPENMANLDKNPLNMSPERFNDEFKKRLNLDNLDSIAGNLAGDDVETKAQIKKALSDVKTFKMDMSELQELDKEIVESKFDYASARGKLVHSGLAVGDSVVADFKAKGEMGLQSPAAKNGKEINLGMNYEAKKEEAAAKRDQNRDRDRGIKAPNLGLDTN